MSQKAVQRQARYREYFNKYMPMLKASLKDKTDEEADAYIAEFQERLDMMFVNVPQIADDWDAFVVATNEIRYRMVIDDPNISQEEKDEYIAKHRDYLKRAPKRTPMVLLAILVVVVVVLAIFLIVKFALGM